MKKYVLSAALLLCGALGAYAQTKGTNSIGLGIENSKNKYTLVDGSTHESQYSNYSLRYANFVKDNVKIGIGLSYGDSEQVDKSKTKNYGASFLYQKYFPVYKKLYVFVGGEAGYIYTKANSFTYENGGMRAIEVKANAYSLGAYGGASYFLGKHWELEARLLNASAGYMTSKNKDMGYSQKNTNFSLKTTGAFTNLGFSINFLF